MLELEFMFGLGQGGRERELKIIIGSPQGSMLGEQSHPKEPSYLGYIGYRNWKEQVCLVLQSPS